MLVDVEFLLKETLDRSLAFFSEPTKENGQSRLTPAEVEGIFGHEVVSEGVYFVGSPNAGNHLREVLDLERRYRDEWCANRSYGTADSVEQILAHAEPGSLEQACVLLVVRVDEIPEKSGPYIGERGDEFGRVPDGLYVNWSLLPVDRKKLEAALEKRSAPAPAL